MTRIIWTWRRISQRLLCGLVAPACLSFTGTAHGDELAKTTAALPLGAPPVEILPAPTAPVSAAPAATATALDIAAASKIALERQPTVSAARLGVSGACTRAEAVNRIHTGGILIARDLPVRKQQAALGLQNAEAALRVAEADTIHAVTFTYLAALYAQQQQAVLDKAKDDFEIIYRKPIKAWVDGEERKKFINASHLFLIDSFIETLDGRRLEALYGRDRALAGLREAMGLGADCPIYLTMTAMPVPVIVKEPTKEELVALALARRGEIAQTATAVQVTCLEITAQGKTFLPTLRTFAASSDIHAQAIPTGSNGMEYKPGALGLEMPTMLAGSRSGRVEQATNYHQRAELVAEKTRNLITLETEVAFARYVELKEKAAHLKKAADAAEKFSQFVAKRFREGAESGFRVADPMNDPPAVRLDETMSVSGAAVKARIDANQAYFEYLLSLAVLERTTAGGFKVEFVPASPTVMPEAK